MIESQKVEEAVERLSSYRDHVRGRAEILRRFADQFADKSDPYWEIAEHDADREERIAADLQAALQALAERTKALAPFAAVADSYEPDSTQETRLGDDFDGSEVLYGRSTPDLGDFRRARQALTSSDQPQSKGKTSGVPG